jgi:hypothetical protein
MGAALPEASRVRSEPQANEVHKNGRGPTALGPVED